MIEFLNNKKKKSGFVSLLTTTTLGGIIFIISLATTYLVFWSSQNLLNSQKGLKAYYAAYSGLEEGLIRLTRNKDFNGTFNLSVNSTNDVAVSVSNLTNQATIEAIATVDGKISKKLQLITGIDAVTGLITPATSKELTF